MALRRISSTPASSSTFARSPDAPSWSSRLREAVFGPGGRVPRFLRQMAENALQLQPPLNWLGGIETRTVDGRETIDIKLQGTALFVDVARIYALAHGCAETHTRLRLLGIAQPLGAPAHEAEGWVAAFEFLQTLRLQAQIEYASDAAAAQAGMRIRT